MCLQFSGGGREGGRLTGSICKSLAYFRLKYIVLRFDVFVLFVVPNRLQAVPFWLVERVRSQRSKTGARKINEKRLPTIQKGTAGSLLRSLKTYHVFRPTICLTEAIDRTL